MTTTIHDRQLPLEHAEAMARRQLRASSRHADLWALLDAVPDPEMPMLSIWELGILQNVTRTGSLVTVTLTPTYAGCPAMQTIRDDVRAVLGAAGFHEVNIELQLQPAWTTDWLDRGTRDKLLATGIAPPGVDVECPRCGAGTVRQISEFGSTACKALYRCTQCLEVFDRLKMI